MTSKEAAGIAKLLSEMLQFMVCGYNDNGPYFHYLCEKARKTLVELDKTTADSPTGDNAVSEQAIAALEAAKNGLEWYRDHCPEAVDDSDGEMDEQIDAAILALRREK